MPKAEPTVAPVERAPTPFADRAIALVEDFARAVDGLHAKALSYHDAGVIRDMHPQVEAALRLQVRSMTAMVDQINCPLAYIPGVTPIPPPPHLGDGSLEEAALFRSKQARAAAVNAIPITSEQKARAQAAEQRALQALPTPKGSTNAAR
jgi:hypothetical protein